MKYSSILSKKGELAEGGTLLYKANVVTLEAKVPSTRKLNRGNILGTNRWTSSHDPNLGSLKTRGRKHHLFVPCCCVHYLVLGLSYAQVRIFKEKKKSQHLGSVYCIGSRGVGHTHVQY